MARWGLFDKEIWTTINAVHAPKTFYSYSQNFERFQLFLFEIGKTVDTCQPEDVLTFMQDFVKAQRSASLIRTVQASLTHFFKLYKRETIMFSPLVQLFVKGAQKLAPLPVKKTKIWDADVPLRMIAKSAVPTEFLPAGREAMLLLLLATGIRVDCANKLSMVFDDCGTYCSFPYLMARKTGPSGPRNIKRFTPNPRICPVAALERFLALALPIRKEADLFLFISSTGHRAHVDTLRHWTEFLLEKCGIVASAGSCRSASTSSAVERNQPIDLVMRSANWALDNTFFKFYKREVDRSVVLQKVPPTLFEGVVLDEEP